MPTPKLKRCLSKRGSWSVAPKTTPKPRSPLFEGSTRGEIVLYRKALEELQARRLAQRQIQYLFPDDGPLCRANYPKHLEFFQAGAQARERLFISANRIGKTKAGCFEDALHLTG